MSFYQLLRSFARDDGLPFADLLPEEVIQKVAGEVGISSVVEDGDDTIYTQPVTLWAFLSQVLYSGAQRSCSAAVFRVMTLCIALNRTPCSADTGAYCRARARLPLLLIQRLTTHIADAAESQVPQTWLWKGRHVHLVDGTTVSTPDTPSLQEMYPQPTCQKEGLGFPMIRMVVLMSLATAMLKDLAMGPYAGKKTGETALFRELLDRLTPGDVVLADRYYCSYFLLALLKERHMDSVFRLHQGRTADFTRGRKLGHEDHIAVWSRPPKPAWMDSETYERMPETMEMREVLVHVSKPGFRVETLVVVTTLTNAQVISRDDIAELYYKRWHVELDIATLKITLGLDVLRCKSPEMVHKEIWVALLAHNLIRQSMLQAALLREVSPRQLSFTAALQSTASIYTPMIMCPQATACQLIAMHLQGMGTHRIGHRPGRTEPRAIKRRPKPHDLLTKPRKEARAELIKPQASKEAVQ